MCLATFDITGDQLERRRVREHPAKRHHRRGYLQRHANRLPAKRTDSSTANGINDNDFIVGSSLSSGTNQITEAFIYDAF